MKTLKARTNDYTTWATVLDGLGDRYEGHVSKVNNSRTDSMTAERFTSSISNFGLGGRASWYPAASAWAEALRGVEVVGAVYSYGTPIAVGVETDRGVRWVAPAELVGAYSVTTSRHQGTLRRSGAVAEVTASGLPSVLFGTLSTAAEVETATVLWREGMALADAAAAARALCASPVAA